MIREVLNEPSDKKRSREDKEEGEESFYLVDLSVAIQTTSI
jgi:hypothetical protein